MAHTLFITAFNPDFSPSFKNWIRKNINSSMVNPQDEEQSYLLEAVRDGGYILSPEDKAIIVELESQNVEYVEF